MSDILQGINSVLEALKAKRKINLIHIARGKVDDRLQLVLQMAKDQGIKVVRAQKADLDKMAGKYHQGVVAEAEPYRYYSLEDISDQAGTEQPLLLLLDGVQDPQNLGAIIRTSECMGVNGVIIPKHGACEVTSAVTRASAGASEHLKVARVTNLVQTLKELKKRGFWIVGTDSQAPQSYFDISFLGPIALVIGGEGKGIRRLVGENCDYMVYIPMAGQINSLNASVSSAIVLGEIVRQRLTAAKING